MSKLMVQVSDAAELLAVHSYFPDMLLLRLFSFREPIFSSGRGHDVQTQSQRARRDKATMGRVTALSKSKFRDGSKLEHLLKIVAMVQNNSVSLNLTWAKHTVTSCKWTRGQCSVKGSSASPKMSNVKKQVVEYVLLCVHFTDSITNRTHSVFVKQLPITGLGSHSSPSSRHSDRQ